MTLVREFKLPETGLSSLPTGSVKNVVDALGRRIADGHFRPGETIPMEAVLSEEYQVSRTVLREAIKVLSGKGLIRTARRYGSRVQPFEDWHLLDPDVIGWHSPNSPMASRIYRESTCLRMVVEPEAAAKAAIRASREQRDTIMAAAEAMSPEPYGVAGMIAADYAFHSTILDATGNIMLAQLNGLILSLLQFSYPEGPNSAAPFHIPEKGHLRVAEAIRVQDPEAARSSMLQMLEFNRNYADVLDA